MNNQLSKMHLVPVLKGSQEYSFVSYSLKMNLLSSTVCITDILEVSNPRLTQRFEKETKDLLCLSSWVDFSSIQEEDLFSNGFQFSENEGMLFNVGQIKLKESQITKKMVLCKIGVGRAYNATERFSSIGSIPDGYQSFYVDKKEICFNEKDINDCVGNNYSHQYVIKRRERVLPTHVVTFVFDKEEEEKSQKNLLCDNCETKEASLFCKTERVNLCFDCDKEIHSGKITSRHFRSDLTDFQLFSHCSIHPEKSVEFFCPTCCLPVCVHCKMIGHHSSGDTTKHSLITVSDAFKHVSQYLKEEEENPRMETIKKQASSIMERAMCIEENTNRVQKEADEIYKRICFDIKTQKERKTNLLKGDLSELQRQAQEIKQLSFFLRYQYNGNNKGLFLLDWSNHLLLKEKLQDFNHFKSSIDVYPDVKLVGDICAIAEEEEKTLSSIVELSRENISLNNLSEGSKQEQLSDYVSEALRLSSLEQ